MWVAPRAILFLIPQAFAAMSVIRNTLNSDDFAQPGGAKLTSGILIRQTGALGSLSICLRFHLKTIGRLSESAGGFVFGIGKEGSEESPGAGHVRLTVWDRITYVSLGRYGVRGEFSSVLLQGRPGDYSFVVAPYAWNHLCLTWSRSEQLVVALNGKQVEVDMRPADLANFSMPAQTLAEAYLMMWDDVGGQLTNSRWTNPGARVSDFNVWDRGISLKEMEDWTDCRSSAEGNTIKWSEAVWELRNAEIENGTASMVCKPLGPKEVLFRAIRMNYMELKRFCKKLRGNITVMDPNADFKRLRDSDMTWTGWDDQINEGTFTNANSRGATLDLESGVLFAGEPNGGRYENCLVTEGGSSWFDYPCERHLSTGLCTVPKRTIFQLRGLPYAAEFDHHYTMVTEARQAADGHYSFHGYSGGKIEFKISTKEWVIREASSNRSASILRMEGDDGEEEYPLGVRNWLWTRTEYHGGADKHVHTIELNLNACNGSEYTCHDGGCIDINHRCDGIRHCLDSSDETDCRKIRLPASYKKSVPVPSAKGEQGRAEITANFKIYNILSVDERDSLMRIKFSLGLEWRDPNVTYLNLKKRNLVKLKEGRKIWIPELVFTNTAESDLSRYDNYSVLRIRRQGKPRISRNSDLDNQHEYDGAENDLVLKRVYTIEFLCEFSMQNYPFDVQKCDMLLKIRGFDTKLTAGTVLYTGPKDLRQYYVHEYGISETEMHVVVEIVLARRLLRHVLTTVLPSMSICIVSFCTNYFDPNNFTPIISVNLTALLVLTTIFIGVYNSLAYTAYAKLIDIWLLANLLVPFFEVILHTATHTIGLDENEAATNIRLVSPTDKTILKCDTKALREQRCRRERVLKLIDALTCKVLPMVYFLFCAFMITYGLMV